MELNESQINIRKRWLQSLLGRVGLNAVCFLFLIGNYRARILSEEELIANGIQFVLAIALAGLLYFFSYKRCGTAFLTSMLVISPIGLLNSMGEALKTDIDAFDVTFLLLHLAVFLWWYRASLDLRKLNKSIRKARLISDEN